ncbi:ABC transporter permease [Salipaludibacillus neizhouensis]|uniref:ABC transporter permease n=1 Tax=Salipaludibacillus neizhouensis TaxID=885475 RepID=A0A3A9KY31_9BACI|nr:ABC transporter permease subunit [Salipaludibacillus neizhouensis]RKL69256.1 ABC transporter permease [Salipaludibacillus neizhouensis]
MKWFKQTKYVWPLVPAVLFVFIFVGYAIMMALLESITINGQWTLDAYKQLLENQSFRDSILFSLKVTLTSTFISLFIGVVITRWMYYYLRNYWVKVLIWIPMLFPHFVWGYIVILLFSQSGWFSGLLYELGLLEDFTHFPVLTQDQHGIGIISTYIFKEVPFVILIILPVYIQMNHQYKHVVQTLGGSKWEIFKTVEWPTIFPVLSEAGIIIFAFVLSAFEVPFLLGATYPKMVSILSYDWFFQGDWSQRPMAFAAMIIVTSIIVICSIVLFSMTNRLRIRVSKGER